MADADRLEWEDGDATNQQIRIRIINDDLPEDEERITVLLTDAEGGVGLGKAGQIVRIPANDGAEDGPGQLEFRRALDVIEVFEFPGEDAAFRVPVRRTGGSQGPVSVRYSTTNGTATAGTDFRTLSGTLNWTHGDTEDKLIRVVVIDDRTVEGNEDFQIRLSDPTGGATIPPLARTKLVRILDNDTMHPAAVAVRHSDWPRPVCKSARAARSTSLSCEAAHRQVP